MLTVVVNLIFILIAANPRLLGQAGSPSGHDLRFEHLSLSDGLSQSTVLSIFEDSKGFIWFGTRHGINKYDGYNFEVYAHDPDDAASISNNWINAILEDSLHHLWVGTQRGLNRLDLGPSAGYDPRNKEFKRYLSTTSARPILGAETILTLFEDHDGILWAGTTNGLFRFDRPTDTFKKIDLITKDNTDCHLIVTAIAEDTNQQMWVGTRQQGLFVVDKNGLIIEHYAAKKKSHRQNNTTVKGFVINSVSGIIADRKGNIWIATQGGGLSCIPQKNRNWKTFSAGNEAGSLNSGYINDLSYDGGNLLWLTTGRGLTKFNIDSETAVNYRPQAKNRGLPPPNSPAILVDRAGTVWVGGMLSGIFKASSRSDQFKTHTHRPGSGNWSWSRLVYSFCEADDQRVWIGTGRGLALFDPREEAFYPVEKINPHLKRISGNVFAIYRDNQHSIWIGTNGQGLFRLSTVNGEVFSKLKQFKYDHNYHDSIGSNLIWCVYQDRKGVLWVGTNGGGLNKFSFETETFTRYRIYSSAFSMPHANWVRTIFEDSQGRLWVGTEGYGLNQLDRNSGTFKTYLNIPGNEKSLSHNSVTSIYEDKDNHLWVSTYGGGINRFDPETEHFERFTKKQGLTNHVVYGILSAGAGTLWLSTNKGLALFDIENRTFKNYDVDDGLQSNEFNSSAYHKSKNGELFFGGIRGFNHFFPDEIKENLIPPRVLLTSVNALDRPVALNSEVGLLRLPHDHNFLSFEFVALDYANSAKNQYAYRLQGLDEEWIYSDTRRYASYTNLMPGEYTFRVKGANNHGVWSEDTRISFEIRPPFWRTWWFSVLFGCACLAFVYGVHRARLRAKINQVLAIESVRKKVAADFHDELGHKLTKISLFAEQIKRRLNGSTPEVRDYVEKIEQISGNLYDGVRDFIWTLNPEKDSLYEIAVRLKDFGDDFFDKTGVHFRVKDLDERLKMISVPMERKHHILLIFKEAMNNILRHAHCTSVLLEFKRMPNGWNISLQDNGVGFRRNGKQSGNGLNNMRHRTDRVGGQLAIQSDCDQGCSISLTVLDNS